MSSSRSVPLDASESASPYASRSAVFRQDSDSISVSISLSHEEAAAAAGVAPREDSSGHDYDSNSAAGATSGRSAQHSELRIVIPAHSPFTPPLRPLDSTCRSPPTAPQTATVVPRYPAYPAALPLSASLGPNVAYDPNVAAALGQLTTQKSAVALLNADVSARRLKEAVRGGGRRSGVHHAALSLSLAATPMDASLGVSPSHAADSQDVSQGPPPPRSTSLTSRGFMESITQMFQPKSKAKAAPKSTEGVYMLDDVELVASPVAAASSSPSGKHRRFEARSPSSSAVVPAPASFRTTTPPLPPVRPAASSAPGGGSSTTTTGHPVDRTGPAEDPPAPTDALAVVDAGRPKSNKSPDRGQSSTSNSNSNSNSGNEPSSPAETEGDRNDIGMDRVLEEAAKVKGLRLTWLLYAMIVLVICLFVLVFLLISFSTNNTIRQSGRHMIQSLTVSTTNNAELLRYDLEQFFLVVNSTFMLFANGFDTSNMTDEVFCSRLYGAPIAFTFYDGQGKMGWTLVCDEDRVTMADVPDVLPDNVIASGDTARLVEHSDRAVAAYYTITELDNAHVNVGTLAVFLSKAIIGRFLMSNFLPEYSTATLQGLDLGVLLPSWSSDEPHVVLTTLTAEEPYYGARQPTRLAERLQSTFQSVCGNGQSGYVWHSVVREGNAVEREDADESFPYTLGERPGKSVWRNSVYTPSPRTKYQASGSPSRNSTTNAFPTPYMERKGTWGITSRMALCSVLCTDEVRDTCTSQNPSSVWFVIDTSLKELNQEAALNIVGGISIVAVVLFSFILLLAYIGISLPIHFLRYQLLRTVGSKEEKSGCEQRVYTITRRFWISDLVSLVRAIHILSLGFRLNKKYVPEHVLRNHAKQLYALKGRFGVLETNLDEVSSTLSEDEDDDASLDSDGGTGAARPRLDGLYEFTAATSMRREPSVQLRHGPRDDTDGTGAGATLGSLSHLPEESSLLHRTRSKLSSRGNILGNASSPSPVRRGGGAVAASRRETNNSVSGTTEDPFSRSHAPLPNRDFLVAEASVDFTATLNAAEGGGGGHGGHGGSAASLIPRPQMEIRRDSDATILCIRIGDVDNAYLMDYYVALKQHRRIMRFLLSRIRSHKGAVFYRTGECLAAAWNAFDNCYNHAEYAAACAQDIAAAFAPYREEGLQVGIVLHQGTLVCGTVEDTREAFETAFGDGPRQAVALAELAAVQPAFSILITEPVKQALSSKYECFIVDVVRIPALIHSLILFELGTPRALSRQQMRQSPASVGSPSSPMPSPLIIQYAKAFALFRNHEFKAALDGIQTIRQNYPCTYRVQRLLQRLELLSHYYRRNDATLPMPYSRAMPAWDNYELVAAVEAATDGCAACTAPEEWCLPAIALPPDGTASSRPNASPTSTLAPAGRGVPTPDDNDETLSSTGARPDDASGAGTHPNSPGTAAATSAPHAHRHLHYPHSSNGSAPSGSPTAAPGYALPEVLYHTVLHVTEDEISFKRELHDNVKRLGTPGQKSPNMRPQKATHPLGPDTSSSSNPASPGHTPHILTRTGQHAYPNTDSLPPLPVLPASMTEAAGDRALLSASGYPELSDRNVDAATSTHPSGGSTSVVTGLDDSGSITLTNGPQPPSARRNTLALACSPTDAPATLPPPLGGLGPRLPTSSEEGTSPHPRGGPTADKRQAPGAATHADPAATLERNDDSENKTKTQDSEADVAPSTPSHRAPLSVVTEDMSTEQQRCFSVANHSTQQPPVPLDPSQGPSDALQHRLNSFVSVSPSEPDANVTSIIQSIGVSIAEADGNQFLSMSFAPAAELPTEILGKNRTTYMRSNRILGRGSFGSVYLGMEVLSGKLVAIKFLPMPLEDAEIEAVEAEVNIMQLVKDSHVVEFITYAFGRDCIILVMECMMAGSLQNMISAFKVIPSATAHLFMRDMLRGLNKLHSMGIIHRDVKPQNVLLTLAGNCKISDFGASAWLHELARKEAQGLVLGTPVYLAPEAARGKPEEASDVWSCGIVFLQLITGSLPYTKEQLDLPAPILVYQIGIGGAAPVIPDTLEELDAAFVRACLQTNPQERKTARQLLQMPLFSL